MKLAKILTDEADALILRVKAKPDDAAMSRILTFTNSVAHDAYMAYLDDKNARAKALNKLADKVRSAALKARAAASQQAA
jgi:hypothetical protein